ncbi:transcriptional antiterminator, partial [Enterococcus faecalis]|nr:transcriptional antiterminator [Enterococcus faecalis]
AERTVRADIANLNDTLSKVGCTITVLRGPGDLLTSHSREQFDDWWAESMSSSGSFLTSSEQRKAYLLFSLSINDPPLSWDDFF